MGYERRIVCSLDILGFVNLVERTVEDGKPVEKRIQDISTILSIGSNHIRKQPEWVYKIKGFDYTTNISHFSDSIVISCTDTSEEEVMETIITLFGILNKLVSMGVVCRGGIAVGLMHHEGATLFGPAMNRAYQLEHDIAIYPRIVLDKEVYKLAKLSDVHRPHPFVWCADNLLRKDADGYYYIDYIGSPAGSAYKNDWKKYRTKIKKVIVEGLNYTDPRTKQKYEWMREKFNASRTELDEVNDELNSELL